ncbi:MAG TPA: hypothetical protein VFF79_09180 [Conexibacter sp.]|jgi:hypothetical protein|nr:hypothetical protein [Conexibacter sp.]
MPDQPISAQYTLPDTDEQTQAAILSHALHVFPAPLTTEELMLDITAGSQEFVEVDGTRNALRSLLRDGLLRQNGVLILPVRAVVRFNELRDAGM